MNIYDTMFIIQFLVVISITLLKVWNLMSYKTDKKLNEKDSNDDYTLFYDIRVAFILFIAFFITWGSGLMILILDHNNLLISTLFKFETLFVLLNVMFFIIELIIHFSIKFSKQENIIQPYYANNPDRFN